MLMSTKKSAKIGRYLNTFTTEGFSETRPFMHLSKHRVNNFRNAGALRLIFFFFSKCSKFNVHSKNAMKNSEKVFSFSDNCI